MKIEFKLSEIDKILDEYLLDKIKKYSIITFKGPLGAGKSTLIRKILQRMGVQNNITSPTFNYMNVYTNDKGEIFNHFDLYRLQDLQDFLNIGFGEYLNHLENKKIWNFVEWPEILENFLENKSLKPYVLNIILSYDETNLNKRIIEF